MAENQSAVTTRHNGAHHDVKGSTVIADSVVSTIAGIAARDTGGVYAMGGGMSRTIGAVRDRVAGSEDPTRGVKVEVGEKQAAIDLEIVVEYGSPIAQTAGDIRSNVSDAVQGMTGLDVVEANVTVSDVHIAGSDDDENADNSRVV
ncbi:Asp23/Gls24 family envelope stress response protein [Streptomyces sp. SID3212]|uniref:Asp23/Gls24 family envelope stress response protein n=1 Tax=unclassified Streptomyces TaxID=2593676 RepID=UPI00136DC9A1|nr:Asp23/Gls24 family envelope stress response protein [Streptomyces sp. SID3212]MYV55117.1 Asp23/Gls24 family envelope stress response protein [Streptomyces sp. SID3212]